MIGEIVGGYRVTSRLGEGGMGVVYLAEHTIMGRRAAVKVLHPKLSRDQEMVQRFFNEARAAGSISHPGIVSVFDLGLREDGSAFIVMDYLEGESLAQRLHRKGRLDSHEALSITRQILSALSAAHAKGIVHRDLKPDNIFIVPDAEVPGGERIKLLDFGIAKLQGDGDASVVTTRAGALMGTPIYMSPEQCRGAGECDQRTDLYAVGIMLFELLTGKPPFVADAAGDLMAAHMRDAPPTLTAKIGPTSIELEEFVARLLAKSPTDRYATGEDAISKIDSATHGVLSSGVRNPTKVPTAPGDREFDPMADTALGTLPLQNQSTTLRNTTGSVDIPEATESKSTPHRGLAMGLALAVCGGALAFVLLRGSDDPVSEPAFATQGVPGFDAAPVPALDAAPAATVATPRAEALPPIDLEPVDEERTGRAKRLHKRALELHRGEVYEEAFVAYQQALEADPGHLIARYNYACLLNVAGELHEGLAILGQLKSAGCPTCLGRLVRARSDSEWKSAWEEPAFQELTNDVRLELPSTNESGRLFARALTEETIESVAGLFAPRALVTLRFRPAGCEGRACTERAKFAGSSGLQSWLSDRQPLAESGAQRCTRDCCRFKPGPAAGLQLRRMCTSLDSGSVRTISELDFAMAE